MERSHSEIDDELNRLEQETAARTKLVGNASTWAELKEVVQNFATVPGSNNLYTGAELNTAIDMFIANPLISFANAITKTYGIRAKVLELYRNSEKGTWG